MQNINIKLNSSHTVVWSNAFSENRDNNVEKNK